jgi:hypothetical protein
MAVLHEAAEQRLAFYFGRKRIEFTLTFADRRNLRINVHPDGRVTAAAPKGRSIEEVSSRVRRRAAWIVRQKEHFLRLGPLQPPRRYISGETHRYLGRQYRLKVVKTNEESVKLAGQYLWVHTASPRDVDHVRLLLDRWFNSRGREAILRRLAICLERMAPLGLPTPDVLFRRMRRRWGSCSPKGTICLNPDLVVAPIPCIDYLLIHELCHLKYPHHGQDFYRLLSRFVPDWKRWKERLEIAHV